MRCRTHPPVDFPDSVYTWVLRLDQYAVDGPRFVPHWMPKSAGTKPTNKKVSRLLKNVNNIATVILVTSCHYVCYAVSSCRVYAPTQDMLQTWCMHGL